MLPVTNESAPFCFHNAISGLASVLGGVLGYFLVGPWTELFPYLLVIAASTTRRVLMSSGASSACAVAVSDTWARMARTPRISPIVDRPRAEWDVCRMDQPPGIRNGLRHSAVRFRPPDLPAHEAQLRHGAFRDLERATI